MSEILMFFYAMSLAYHWWSVASVLESGLVSLVLFKLAIEIP